MIVKDYEELKTRYLDRHRRVRSDPHDPKVLTHVYIAMIEGKQFVTTNGKCFWKAPGHLKNALYAFSPFCYQSKEVVQQMIKDGIIEIVKVPLEPFGLPT